MCRKDKNKKCSGLSCFKDFKCVASQCADNCCIGWEIDIDDETLKYYNSIKGKFGEKLRSGISYGDCACFKMDAEERCPFLNSENLCEIIINLGEDKIPYICKNHPRFYEWLYDRCEEGIGICCPEAARLLYKSEKKINTDISYTLTGALSDAVTYARETAFYILQNRKVSLCERLILFLEYCDELDEVLFLEDVEEIISIADRYKYEINVDIAKYEKKDLTEELFNLFSSLEPINCEWTECVEMMTDKMSEVVESRKRFLADFTHKIYEYEHLSVYLAYRYFLKCLEDMDVLSKGKFIVVCILFNIFMDIYSYLKCNIYSRIDNSVIFSKEVEYSEENINIIYDALEENFSNLQGYIKFIYAENY